MNDHGWSSQLKNGNLNPAQWLAVAVSHLDSGFAVLPFYLFKNRIHGNWGERERGRERERVCGGGEVAIPSIQGGLYSRLSQWTLVVNAAARYTLFFLLCKQVLSKGVAMYELKWTCHMYAPCHALCRHVPKIGYKTDTHILRVVTCSKTFGPA